MAATPAKSNAWCFTINNPTQEEINSLWEDTHRYIIFQWEAGKQTGTVHIQGVVYYKNPRVSPKRRWPRGHWEICRCIAASIKYCSKEDTRLPGDDTGPFEKGEKPEKGSRSDLTEIGSRIIAGEELASIAISAPEAYIKYGRGLKLLKNDIMTPRSTMPCIIWVWGPTGVGKSTWCSKQPHKSFYYKDNTKWWDGYAQEEAIIIEEFVPSKWEIDDLLKFLDQFPYKGQYKGGYVHINSPWIYINSVESPMSMYDGIPWLAEQMRKRITRVIELERDRSEEPKYKWNTEKVKV